MRAVRLGGIPLHPRRKTVITNRTDVQRPAERSLPPSSNPQSKHHRFDPSSAPLPGFLTIISLTAMGQAREHLHLASGFPALSRVKRNVPDVCRFKNYVSRLADEGGMSGDETDCCGREPIRGQRKFLVVRPGWRSQEVANWLRVIENLYAVHRFSLNGRASRGNWARQRIDSGKVDWEFPVSGLPENFYGSEACLRRKEISWRCSLGLVWNTLQRSLGKCSVY